MRKFHDTAEGKNGFEAYFRSNITIYQKDRQKNIVTKTKKTSTKNQHIAISKSKIKYATCCSSCKQTSERKESRNPVTTLKS